MVVRTLDIFCGGGGGSYGARAGGAKIVCGIDLDSVATAIYKHNFPKTTVRTSRLENIRPNKLRDQIGDIDLLLASPECTDHTWAKGSAPRSEASRATAMQTIRFAKAFQPRWVVLENVTHMRPWSRYGELIETLGNIGYNLKEFVLDASNFGVGQKRKRLFIVADKVGEPTDISAPKNAKAPTVESLLDKPGTWKTTPLYKDGRAEATIARAERGFDTLGRETPFLLVYYGSDGSGGWQRIDRPLRTITTVDRFALIEPSDDGHRMRMLQVPELRRAMGFRNDFKLDHGTRRDRVRILGNGVCPPVMKAVVESLISGA